MKFIGEKYYDSSSKTEFLIIFFQKTHHENLNDFLNDFIKLEL